MRGVVVCGGGVGKQCRSVTLRLPACFLLLPIHLPTLKLRGVHGALLMLSSLQLSMHACLDACHCITWHAHACMRPHLSLAEERDGLAELPQQQPHFAVICGDNDLADLAAQLKIFQDLFLELPVLVAGLQEQAAKAMRTDQQVAKASKLAECAPSQTPKAAAHVCTSGRANVSILQTAALAVSGPCMQKNTGCVYACNRSSLAPPAASRN